MTGACAVVLSRDFTGRVVYVCVCVCVCFIPPTSMTSSQYNIRITFSLFVCVWACASLLIISLLTLL